MQNVTPVCIFNPKGKGGHSSKDASSNRPGITGLSNETWVHRVTVGTSVVTGVYKLLTC